MASNYPTSLDSFTDPLTNSPLNNPSHAVQHQNINDAVEKLETKVGIAASPASSATAGQVLTANGAGGSTWVNGGLVLVKSQTIGTGVTSLTVTDCFTSEFENYKVILTVDSNSANNADGYMQLRTSGGSTSTTGYYNNLIYSTIGVSGPSAATGQNQGYFNYAISMMGTNGTAMSYDILRPNVTKYTTLLGQMTRGDVTGTISGYHAVNTAYASMVYTLVSGNMTGGTVKVYGYR